MLGQLTRARSRRVAPYSASRARFRPTLELLESRLAPSATRPVVPVDVPPLVQDSVVHVASQTPAELDHTVAAAHGIQAARTSAMSNHDNLPLLAWVTGMTLVLMLRWEHRAIGVRLTRPA